jgi:hypothetical protein
MISLSQLTWEVMNITEREYTSTQFSWRAETRNRAKTESDSCLLICPPCPFLRLLGTAHTTSSQQRNVHGKDPYQNSALGLH